MRANLGKCVVLSFVVLGGFARVARAQAYDFATCDPAVTATTACTATVTSCCHQITTAGSAFLQDVTVGTDYAIVIPMDECHQGSASDDTGNPPGLTASSQWCRNPTNAGQLMKIYGLAYRLMQVDIPVYWIINPSKDPVALGCASPGSCRQIATDVDMWVMDAAGTTPPDANVALTSPQVGTPIKHWLATAAGAFAVDATWTYDRKQFPIRGSALVIAARDRANFNKFMRRQAPYASWAATPVRSCGNGTSCQDFSGIDYFEIQPTASIGFTNFVANPLGTPGALGFLAGKLPVAVLLDYSPPRVAERPGPVGVSKKWLEVANLSDTATNTATCPNGTFTPTDAVMCDLTAADVIAGKLVSGNFGWLWLDHFNAGCGGEMAAINTFVTAQAGTRAAGNVLGIAEGSQAEECSNQQLLGKVQAANSLGISNGSTPTDQIVRYPQNLMNQWGNIVLDVASGLGGDGFEFYGSTYGYHPAFTSGVNPNSLHRLVSPDVNSGANTFCTRQKSSATCDVMGGASGESRDLAVYGRYLNAPENGLVFYVPGTQIQNKPSELRMVLNSLLALPLGTVPIAGSTIKEVSRNSPIVAAVNGNPAVVQGTYEVSSPTPTVTTFSVDGNAGTFRFPYFKGHLRARTASTIGTTATTFGSAGVLFDAANGIPATTNSFGGCGTNFTSACRTIFTTTDAVRTSTGIALKFFTSANATTIGPIMGSNLTPANQQVLMQRVIAGDDSASAGTFVAKLGGVDRSTVAVIEASNLVSGTRPTMAYFGATDGMLHAVCVTTGGTCTAIGQELWAYIPRKLLPMLRMNTGRLDGTPHVIDAFGDFYGTGSKSWKTILTFQTGSGNATAQDRIPATYALDISNPFAPKVLWEYGIQNTSSLAVLEPGIGLSTAMGPVRVGTALKNLTFVQTNNLGSGGAGTVVMAINTETGALEWSTGYVYPSPRTGGNNVVPGTGIPGGATAIDKNGQGYVTDVVYASLYGDLWELDSGTGASRYTSGAAGVPLFRFSTDFQPIGVRPSVYSNGSQQFAVVVSGGFADPTDKHWACNSVDITTCATIHRALAVNLSTLAASAPLTESSGAPNIPFSLALGAGERGFASAFILGNELFLTTDSGNVNSSTYGTSGSASGHVVSYNLTSGATSTVVVQGGAGSVANSGTTLYTGSSDKTQQLSTAAAGTTGTAVDPAGTAKVTRELWLRTE